MYLNLFFSFPVQAGIPDVILLHLSHLPVWLEQVPFTQLLQMVHASSLYALSGGAYCGDSAQTVDTPALCGPQPHPHSTGLGEDWSRGWQQEFAADIGLLKLQMQKLWYENKAVTKSTWSVSIFAIILELFHFVNNHVTQMQWTYIEFYRHIDIAVVYCITMLW